MDRTGCRVSIGIGPNLVLAKLAGQFAKPSNREFGELGVYRVERTKSLEFMGRIKISDLPGFGDKSVINQRMNG